MKSVTRDDIHPMKMILNPPKAVVNAGMRIINKDGYIYEYIDLIWEKGRKAKQEDYSEIPQLL